MAETDVLTDNQIRHNLVSNPLTCPYFEGVYPLDRLPRKRLENRPCLVVCNTAYSDSSGEHWVGFFLTENGVEYFDSYGMPPGSPYFDDFISANSSGSFNHNVRTLQGLFSTTCGKYVTTYLYHRCAGKTLRQYLDLFEGKDADRVVRKMYSSIFKNTIKGCGRGQKCCALIKGEANG